jgi:cell division septum initiation protein DivIVA
MFFKAFAGAMKALQEKVRKLEAENDHLKKSLESKDYYYEQEQWSNTGNVIQGTEEELARVIEELKTQNDWLVRENQQMHDQIIKYDEKEGIEGQIGKMNEVINQVKGGNENVKRSARLNNTNQV